MSKEFQKYQKVRRLGDIYTEGLLDGTVYVFPKLDGANGSVWYDQDELKVKCGSRNLKLSEKKQNQGFYSYVMNNEELVKLAKTYPTLRFYGEWLVPHTIKNYIDGAWNRFYIFDVTTEEGHHVPYHKYVKMIEPFGVDVVPLIKSFKNPTEDKLVELAHRVNFLCEEDTFGEGIVIKNYEYINRYGEQTWGKVVTGEFKKKNYEVFGSPSVPTITEEKIIDGFVTTSFIEKEMSKLGYTLENYPNNIIGEFLGRTWRTFIEEEMFNIIKKLKNPRINFGYLNKLFVDRLKKEMGL